MKRSGEKIKLTSIDELLGVPNEEASMEIRIDEIHGFKNHPFKVLDDEKMQDLVESIRENGILTPVLVRPDNANGYEMISGHRRLHAARLAGLTRIPAFVREMTDDEAVITMVDANIQREELLPSERAWAYKMKMDAMNRQGKRTDLTSRRDVEKLSSDTVGEGSGLSGRQVQRYIRLTELLPDLLDLVDLKRIQFMVAVDISFLSPDVQQYVYEYVKENGVIKAEQVAALRRETDGKTVTQEKVIAILNENLTGRLPSRKVTIPEKKLYQYFPPHYTSSEMEDVIIRLLEKWKEEKEGNEDGI